MDTSKEYIKMCEKAEEIHKNPLQYHTGDCVYYKEKEKCVVLYYNKYHGNPPMKYLDNKLSIWLPRQDQLQGMVSYENNWVDVFVNRFAEFVFNKCRNMSKTLGDISMEQLWLAFVMKEKYNKIWNGTDWGKESQDE